MAIKIGETPAVQVEVSIVRDVPMVVIRDWSGNAVTFPARQLGDVTKLVIDYYAKEAQYGKHNQ